MLLNICINYKKRLNLSYDKVSNMVQLTTQERIFVVRLKEKNVPIAEIQHRFIQRFNRPPPTNKTILRNYEKNLTWGTSLNLNEHNSGRRHKTRTAQNISAVHRILLNNPKSTSVRRNVLQLPKSSFNEIV